jgi:Ca2+-binding RTX toxin-like protein
VARARTGARVWLAVVGVSACSLLAPGVAVGATALVRPSAEAPGSEELVYIAATGETNHVVVSFLGEAPTFTDAGAVVIPGNNCTSVEAHTASCAATAGTSGFFSVRVELGDGDDEVSSLHPPGIPGPGLLLGGGLGNDRLFGGPSSDALDGGGGVDELHGGAGFNMLTDGDLDGENAGPGQAPSQDVLDGGGVAEIGYRQRTTPVLVDIGDNRPDGAAGEGDLLIGFRRVVGGQGADRLAGDDAANLIDGQGGRDVLIGAAATTHWATATARSPAAAGRM